MQYLASGPFTHASCCHSNKLYVWPDLRPPFYYSLGRTPLSTDQGRRANLHGHGNATFSLLKIITRSRHRGPSVTRSPAFYMRWEHVPAYTMSRDTYSHGRLWARQDTRRNARNRPVACQSVGAFFRREAESTDSPLMSGMKSNKMKG